MLDRGYDVNAVDIHVKVGTVISSKKESRRNESSQSWRCDGFEEKAFQRYSEVKTVQKDNWTALSYRMDMTVILDHANYNWK